MPPIENLKNKKHKGSLEAVIDKLRCDKEKVHCANPGNNSAMLSKLSPNIQSAKLSDRRNRKNSDGVMQLKIVQKEKKNGLNATPPTVTPPVEQSNFTLGSMSEKNMFLCFHPGCGQSFPRRYDARKHRDNVHGGHWPPFRPIQGFRCHSQHCHTLAFQTVPNLYTHVQRVHYVGNVKGWKYMVVDDENQSETKHASVDKQKKETSCKR